MEPLIPLIWTSGDGFRSQSGKPYSHLAEAYVLHIPWDSPLLWHLPTSSWLGQSIPHTCEQVLVGLENRMYRAADNRLDLIFCLKRKMSKSKWSRWSPGLDLNSRKIDFIKIVSPLIEINIRKFHFLGRGEFSGFSVFSKFWCRSINLTPLEAPLIRNRNLNDNNTSVN